MAPPRLFLSIETNKRPDQNATRFHLFNPTWWPLWNAKWLSLFLASKPQCLSTLERDTISFVTNIIQKYMVKASVWTTCLFSWKGLAEANEWCRSWWSVADDIFYKYSHRDKEEEGGHIGVTPKQSKWSEPFGFMHTRLYKANTRSNSIEVSRIHQTLLNFDLVENVAAAQSRSSGPFRGAVPKAVGLFKAFNILLR